MQLDSVREILSEQIEDFITDNRETISKLPDEAGDELIDLFKRYYIIL